MARGKQDQPVHWMPRTGGATHAVANPVKARYTLVQASVTCPVCLEHIAAGR